MGNKNQQARQPSFHQLLEIAERDFAKGNIKDALARAKNLFRQNPSEETRSLLERCYAARVEKLIADGFIESALTQFYDLMQMTPQLPSVVIALPRLRVLLGIAQEEERIQVTQSDCGLLGEMGDRLVLRPALESTASVELKEEAARIREALLLIERGEDGAVEELTKLIPRSSPMAEWKLFLRGLISYYQQDLERAKANWSRLDSQRAAHRIAKTLLAFKHGTDTSGDSDTMHRVRRLKNSLVGGTLQSQLEKLLALWKSDDLRGFIKSIKELRQRTGAELKNALDEIGAIAWKRYVREGRWDELSKLMSAIPGPAIDPHWSRVQALFEEGYEDIEVEEVEAKWLKYVHEIPQITTISETHRPLVMGLVHRRIANAYAEEAKREYLYLQAENAEATSSSTNFDSWSARALHFYHASLENYPQLRATHYELANFCEAVQRIDDALAAYRDLVRQFPEDWDAQVWLAYYFIEIDSPGDAASHVAAVTRLKPRENIVSVLNWNQRLSQVRIAIKNRSFVAAMAGIDEMSANSPKDTAPHTIDLLRAAVEYKVPNLPAAERYVAQSLEKASSPAIVWMTLSQCCARYKYDKSIKKQIDENLLTALAQQPTSVAAGELCGYLLAYSSETRKYVGRAQHYQFVKKYLARCGKVAWQLADLRNACRFMFQCLHGPKQLLHKLTIQGVKKFLQEPVFPMILGMVEFQRGPRKCNLYTAQSRLSHALELNRSAEVKLPLFEQQAVEGALATVTNVLESRSFQSFGYNSRYDTAADNEEQDEFDEDDQTGFEFVNKLIGKVDSAAPASKSALQERFKAFAKKLGIPPYVTFEMFLDTVPPDMHKTVAETSALLGISQEEAILMILEEGAANGMIGGKPEKKSNRNSRM